MANFTGWRNYKSKSNKYSNKKASVDGIEFDSRKEARRYKELKLLEHSGKISDLQMQVTFTIEINGEKICDYRCDFQYCENGVLIVEDAKGYRTRIYKMKKKLMKACHDIDIKEV